MYGYLVLLSNLAISSNNFSTRFFGRAKFSKHLQAPVATLYKLHRSYVFLKMNEFLFIFICFRMTDLFFNHEIPRVMPWYSGLH